MADNIGNEVGECLAQIDSVRREVLALQNHPMIDGFAADDELGEAVNHIEAAYADVAQEE